MRRCHYPLFALLTLITAIVMTGCSGGGEAITAPGDVCSPCLREQTAGTMLRGFYQVAIEEATGDVSVIPIRAAGWAMNAVSMLESSAPVGLEVNPNSVHVYPAEHQVTLQARLRHPLPSIAGLFTGFDARGIVFGPRVENADGFTAHMNPNDFLWAPFGYVDGALGTPDWIANYHAPYAGYKYFCDGLGPDDDLVEFMRSVEGYSSRGVFPEGTQHRRTYVLDWDDSDQGYLVFNYAVVVSYAWPLAGSSAPFSISEFSELTANAAEAICFDGEVTDSTAYYWNNDGAGHIWLELEIWDWQGFDDYLVSIAAEDGESIEEHVTSACIPGTTPYSAIFRFDHVSVYPDSMDDVTLIITVTDMSETFGSSWFNGLLPQANWRYDDYVYTVWEMTFEINDEPPCLPWMMNECFNNNSNEWITGPGSFWNISYYTFSAADNRSDALCYGFSEGQTFSWCESRPMTVPLGCYDFPLELRIEHMIDVEEYYDRCWVEIKIGCDPWEKIVPYCGWLYNVNGWWDGWHKQEYTKFMLHDVEEGDTFKIRFVTFTLDGNANCTPDGYNGWQIHEAIISDDL